MSGANASPAGRSHQKMTIDQIPVLPFVGQVSTTLSPRVA
jgi:hypothetical protein